MTCEPECVGAGGLSGLPGTSCLYRSWGIGDALDRNQGLVDLVSGDLLSDLLCFDNLIDHVWIADRYYHMTLDDLNQRGLFHNLCD